MQNLRRNEMKDKNFFQATINKQKIESDQIKSWTEYMVFFLKFFFNLFVFIRVPSSTNKLLFFAKEF